MENNLHTIKNGNLAVVISEKGAEMMSVKYNGTELLWQGDEKYWADRALNLFPYIGRLWEKKYIYRGKEYCLDIHGFIKDNVLSPENITESSITFILKSSDETKKMYPFDFEYSVKYEIKDGTLKVSYDILNNGSDAMYFGVGGHPGINLPLNNEHKFEDYALYFDDTAKPEKAVLSDDCFFTEKYEYYNLDEGGCIRMRHYLFDNDAIILKNCGKNVILKPRSGGIGVKFDISAFKYLGIWHKPKSDAPYVCIEPWSSLPSTKGKVTDLEKQDDLIKLESLKKYSTGFSICPETF